MNRDSKQIEYNQSPISFSILLKTMVEIFIVSNVFIV